MHTHSRSLAVGAAVAVWLGCVSLGLAKLSSYSAAAGAPGSAPVRWPADSTIATKPDESTLVMVAHPQCPCSRASIGELGRLMAEAETPPAAFVLFVRPERFDEAWVESDLWHSAAAIPGVQVVRDDGGREAARFGAATSGQTMLYDADGGLVFSGGITSARGHAGDNAGRSAVVALLARPDADRAETPVFGCALFGAGGGGDGAQICVP